MKSKRIGICCRCDSYGPLYQVEVTDAWKVTKHYFEDICSHCLEEAEEEEDSEE